MNSIHNQIITKLAEMDYTHFTSLDEFKGVIIHLVDTYTLRDQFRNMYGEEIYQQMIEQALISICNLVSPKNFDSQKQTQFINWFNETYITQ